MTTTAGTQTCVISVRNQFIAPGPTVDQAELPPATQYSTVAPMSDTSHSGVLQNSYAKTWITEGDTFSQQSTRVGYMFNTITTGQPAGTIHHYSISLSWRVRGQNYAYASDTSCINLISCSLDLGFPISTKADTRAQFDAAWSNGYAPNAAPHDTKLNLWSKKTVADSGRIPLVYESKTEDASGSGTTAAWNLALPDSSWFTFYMVFSTLASASMHPSGGFEGVVSAARYGNENQSPQWRAEAVKMTATITDPNVYWSSCPG